MSIENEDQDPVSTIWPDSPGQDFLLRILLAVHRGFDEGAPSHSDRGAGAGTHARNPEARDSNEAAPALLDGIDRQDVAELSGRFGFAPSRLRDRGTAVAVEPDLVPCALEALAEQVVSLRVISGNDGVTQRLDIAFNNFSRQGAWLRLGGEEVRLRLGTQALHTAWVVQRAERSALSRAPVRRQWPRPGRYRRGADTGREGACDLASR